MSPAAVAHTTLKQPWVGLQARMMYDVGLLSGRCRYRLSRRCRVVACRAVVLVLGCRGQGSNGFLSLLRSKQNLGEFSIMSPPTTLQRPPSPSTTLGGPPSETDSDTGPSSRTAPPGRRRRKKCQGDSRVNIERRGGHPPFRH